VTAPAAKKVKGLQIGGIRSEYRHRRTVSSSSVASNAISDNESVPASEYQDSSEGVGGLESDLDDGDEAEYARQRDEEKAGRGNLSKVSVEAL
jgi:hypothetical protein